MAEGTGSERGRATSALARGTVLSKLKYDVGGLVQVVAKMGTSKANEQLIQSATHRSHILNDEGVHTAHQRPQNCTLDDQEYAFLRTLGLWILALGFFFVSLFFILVTSGLEQGAKYKKKKQASINGVEKRRQ